MDSAQPPNKTKTILGSSAIHREILRDGTRRIDLSVWRGSLVRGTTQYTAVPGLGWVKEATLFLFADGGCELSAKARHGCDIIFAGQNPLGESLVARDIAHLVNAFVEGRRQAPLTDDEARAAILAGRLA